MKLKADNPKQESWHLKVERLEDGGIRLDLEKHEAISDITALTGLDLTELSLKNTAVADLSALKGMRLTYLNLAGADVEDISVLQGMPITELYLCSDVKVFSALESLPLTIMHFGWSKPKTIKWLEGKNLIYLHMIATGASDISILRDMPLHKLYLGRDVKDLSVLRHLEKLNFIYMDHTRFSDFRTLRNLDRLKYLYFIGPEIRVDDRDLKKLAQHPLHTLVLDNVSGIEDVSCLSECQTLRRLVVPPDVEGINELRKLENLEHLDIEYDWHWPTTVEMFWRIRKFKSD